jgi:superfamily II DNA helicase RecQ
LLKGESAQAIEKWIDAASGAGLIAVSKDEYRILTLTTLGRDVMSGRLTDVTIAAPMLRPARTPGRSRRRKMRAQVYAAASVQSVDLHAGTMAVAEPHPAVVDALREWRREEARRRAVPPYVILHDRTLLAIAAMMPRTAEALLDVPGIGPARMAEYGEAIIAVLAAVRATS